MKSNDNSRDASVQDAAPRLLFLATEEWRGCSGRCGQKEAAVMKSR